MGKFINPFTDMGFPPLVAFRTDVVLAERTTGRLVNGKFRQIYLSMPYFTQERDECRTDFERWIYILKHMDTLDRMPFKARKSVLDKLLDIADVSKLDEKERARYDEALKIYRDYHGTIHSAERKGKAEGKVEGLAEGKAEGKAEGLAEGVAQVALAMKQKGMDIALIADLTGLPIDFISTL